MCAAGMQSAALGFALAQKHFSDVMVCVPAAVSVVFMALGAQPWQCSGGADQQPTEGCRQPSVQIDKNCYS